MRDFFERYDQYIMPEPNTGCWLWIGAWSGRRSKSAVSGYGILNRGGEVLPAHRCAYEAANGDGSANGLVVRHRCDNPACCNPDHLTTGSHQDNMQDAIERDRFPTGEKNASSILTASQAATIKILSGSGIPFVELASAFGISASLVEGIRYGKRWTAELADLPNDPQEFFGWLQERKGSIDPVAFQRAERAAFVARYRHTISKSADYRRTIIRSVVAAVSNLISTGAIAKQHYASQR